MPAELLMTQADIDTDPEYWLSLRREGVTASEMAAVVGLAPPSWGSPFDLYHAKREGWIIEPSEAMEWGHFAEPWVAERFAREHPDLWIADGGLYRSLDRPWQMATYDRLAYPEDDAPGHRLDALGPVQLKTAAILDPDEWGEPGTSAIPIHYRIQLLTEMDVGDYDTGWLPVMDNRHRVVTYVIHRADYEEDIAYLRDAGLAFMERLRNGDEPEVDWTPATATALRRLHPELQDLEVAIPLGLARKWRNAAKAKARAEQRMDLCRNQIMQRMGPAKYAVVAGLTGKRGQPVKLATRVKYYQEPHEVRGFPVDKLQPGKWMP